MYRRSIIRLAALTAFLAVLIAACGGVSGGDIVIDWPGQWPWPGRADIVVDDSYYSEVQVEGHLRMRLEARNGYVSIIGRPDASAVTVTATLLVGSYSRQDAQNGLDDLGVRVDGQTDEILVETLQPEISNGRQYVVNYTITLPADMAIHVSQTNGNVRIQDSAYSVGVSAHNGDIFGSLTVPPHGEISLATVNGDVALDIPVSTSATLSAFAVNGVITYSDLELSGAVYTNYSLKGTLGGGAGEITLHTVNGSVDVAGIGGHG